MITVFGNLESGNVHKAQMILRRVRVPFRRVGVSQTREEPRRPEFLKLNPIGKIPTLLLDNGDVLSESGAILYYFGRDTELWPADTRTQTEVLRWMFFEQYSHEPSLAAIRYLRNYVEDPHRYADRIKDLEPKARHALGAMEQRLTANRWIAGVTCTIADYALYPYTRVADEAGVALAGFSAVNGWLTRFESQPGFLPMRAEGAATTLTFDDYFRTNA